MNDAHIKGHLYLGIDPNGGVIYTNEINNIIIDPYPANKDTGGNVYIKGNLFVDGSNTIVNTETLSINDNIIQLNGSSELELTSGMERFISSLAIRVALINVSALPRPNFIAIDEGWGSLDSEHIAAVINLFEYFRNKFDFSIIISHVDSMRDMVDNLIEVNKLNGFSQISHN